MSAPSVRRLKDRGGAGGKITAPKLSKPLTPCSVAKPLISGKENSKPVSRISAQKPMMRPASKLSGDTAAVPRSFSAPRARNPSPLGRADSAMRNDRSLSRVSANGCEAEKKDKTGFIRNVKVVGSERSADVSRVLRKSGSCKESGGCTGDLSVFGSKTAISRSSRVDVNNVNVRKSKEGPVFVDLLHREMKDRVVVDHKSQDSLSRLIAASQMINETKVDDKLHERRDTFSRLGGASQMNGVAGEKLSYAGMEKSKEKGLGPDSGSNQVEKLHKKVAFLEGKVKGILSDIKRTKEILDMNNPDASKVILTNIQEKISGIEKAMVHSRGDSDAKGGSCKDAAIDVRGSKELREKLKNCGATGSKGLVNDLNSDELEARLFPHHKLLRNRASLKASLVSVKPTTKAYNDDDLCNPVERVVPALEEKRPNPIVEYPTRLESKAILNEEEQLNMEICDAQEMDSSVASSAPEGKISDVKMESSLVLTTDESLDEFDNQENRKGLILEAGNEEACVNQLTEIGCKTATGGWFVSEGEAALLVHDDGSCSYFDIANSEEKAEYKTPVSVPHNIWRDCWIIRAAGSDGCSGRYVVASSAGNSMDSGFCSWEFYTKDVRAFHIENTVPPPSRTVFGPLPNSNPLYRRNVLSNALVTETQRWWYKPCGPLIISTATSQKGVSVYDIRDGEQIMKWEVQRPVLGMDYSSPLQWRSRGKVVIAESEGISLWDVNSIQPQALLSVSSSGRKISALHINNTDAEIGGGVRHRASSSDTEGNDGVFCTTESIEILDFRQPSGIGLKIQKRGGATVDSVFSHGDSIFIGYSKGTAELQQWSMRKQGIVGTYSLPETHSAITQVWGNSMLTMGVCEQGLFVFDSVKEELFFGGKTNPDVRQVIGPNDLYFPSFDYASSRALLVSRDRPASWIYLS